MRRKLPVSPLATLRGGCLWLASPPPRVNRCIPAAVQLRRPAGRNGRPVGDGRADPGLELSAGVRLVFRELDISVSAPGAKTAQEPQQGRTGPQMAAFGAHRRRIKGA